jgi:hypothetical protein
VSRLLDWLVSAENPAAVVYGLLAIGALLAVESGRHETYLDTLLSAVLAACGYWLLHAYAGVLGERLRGGTHLSAGGIARALARDVALLRGAAVPLGVIVVAWIGGAAQGDAVTAALWSSVACLFGFELLAGARAGASAPELLVEGCVGLLLALAVLGLRVLLH